MCKGFQDVLFPTGGEIDLFPISSGSLGMLSVNQAAQNPVIGGASTAIGGGTRLIQIAYNAKEFNTGRNSAIERGQHGPMMYTAEGSRLLWRLADTYPAHKPEMITDELRLKIIDDIKRRKAFEMAEQRAKELATAAVNSSLKEVAEDSGMTVEETGLFTKMKRVQPRLEIFMSCIQLLPEETSATILGRLAGTPPEVRELTAERLARDFATRAGNAQANQYGAYAWQRGILLRPAGNVWNTEIENVTMLIPAHAERFVTAAFSLIPEDDQEASEAVTTVSIPATGEVTASEAS
jgi:hypothetical protein